VLPRQLRLRNLGGLIVVDFIDMGLSAHRAAVMDALRAGCQQDPARIRVSEMSVFGLVELSRKRTRESLVRQFCEPCEICAGSGLVPRAATVAFEVLRALSALSEAHQDVVVEAGEPVIARLLNEEAPHLARIAQNLGVSVHLESLVDGAPGAFELR